jgi:hypothetical protein
MTMAIYGECETRAGRRTVTITGLGSTGCALACDSVNVPLDGEMALWIGAIGPFAVTAIQKNPVQAHAAFKEPLDPRIVEHFTGA